MKVKTLKPHFYEGIHYQVDSEYNCDVVHAGIVERSGVCKVITKAKPKRKTKK